MKKKTVSPIQSFLQEYPVVLAAAVLLVLMCLFVRGFATGKNILTLAQQMSYTGIAACGLAFVLIGGGNDLSIGANITFSSIMAALAMTRLGPSAQSAWVGVTVAILCGVVIGLVNGLCVAKIGMNAFMMTLITQMFLDGLSLIFSNAASIGNLPAGYVAIGTWNFLGVPIPIVLILLFFVGSQFVLKKTAFGRSLYATGANRQAAKLVGLPVDGIQIAAFCFSGFSAAWAGIVLSARLGAATPSSGTYQMLDVMSAAIIGGNSLFGGRGSALGAAFGVMLLGMISNGLNLLGVSYYATMMIKGLIILLAVALDFLNSKLITMRLLKS